jgi:FkbM family methyltransferase
LTFAEQGATVAQFNGVIDAMDDLDFDALYAVNAFGFYCIPKAYKKREVPRLLLKGEVYERNTLRLLQGLCARADGDVVSGGAFIGDFFPAMSQALAQDSRIISFEPNPISFQACSKTISLNGIENITLHPVAIGSEAGTLPLRVQTKSGASMGARAKLAKTQVEGETVDVPVTTLDDLLDTKRKVAVLQLDIEDFELPALIGGQKMIKRDRPVVILEAQKPWLQREYLDKLNALCGEDIYRFSGVIDRNAVYRVV